MPACLLVTGEMPDPFNSLVKLNPKGELQLDLSVTADVILPEALASSFVVEVQSVHPVHVKSVSAKNIQIANGGLLRVSAHQVQVNGVKLTGVRATRDSPAALHAAQDAVIAIKQHAGNATDPVVEIEGVVVASSTNVRATFASLSSVLLVLGFPKVTVRDVVINGTDVLGHADYLADVPPSEVDCRMQVAQQRVGGLVAVYRDDASWTQPLADCIAGGTPPAPPFGAGALEGTQVVLEQLKLTHNLLDFFTAHVTVRDYLKVDVSDVDIINGTAANVDGQGIHATLSVAPKRKVVPIRLDEYDAMIRKYGDA